MRTEQAEEPETHRSLAARARRDQIIQAAAEVVSEVGYANASTARIAERAGISKGVITYHFESKDEILRSVALRFLDRCGQEVEACIEAAATAYEQVHGWIRAELMFFAAHRIESIAMFDIMANHRDPGFGHAFDAEVAAETQRLAEILRRGQQQAEFRPFDTETVAHIILRCRDGLLGSWSQETEEDLNNQIDTLLDFIDHAISLRQ
ncbi:MAG TPA: TetR/AcrR family transcriptional regulator [Jiangellaceae bacterium]|nr:TetR/AcrR family transcriptional regulator [Jiangellaceae bacterium]